MSSIGIIGGTGLEQLQGLDLIREHSADTAFGAPSRPVQEGRLGGQTLFFLHRHGSPRAIPPHRINYRANISALHALGVRRLVAINAVGGISPDMQPGRLVIPDQLVDYTWGREHTFDDGGSGSLLHIDFTEPYDRPLRLALVEAAEAAGIAHEPFGIHGVTQGPRLETAAEVRRLAGDGCDVVGMTGMPEAALARELGMAYACVCMVVNPAAGLGDLPLTLDMMRRILEREAGVVRTLLETLLVALAAPAAAE
ncbi:S-methyl-5'-thioinosine phosphorylase [Haliea sp. E1-2-M8]|uniref:S-methyl-5'-thioinosine phosphorylase n=1 Tax=Haliea sp. E1-2-M8 TaxID=3064706 RepID=UPI00271FFE00|nr:S-methyl-5'-thioinosine phosphorylase [Haliea sp. E1-2-M8]MDO8862409.1 S-methyl-5'-thioinosine phosphorylase [Haliea sp. E1-2-M8]